MLPKFRIFSSIGYIQKFVFIDFDTSDLFSVQWSQTAERSCRSLSCFFLSKWKANPDIVWESDNNLLIGIRKLSQKVDRTFRVSKQNKKKASAFFIYLDARNMVFRKQISWGPKDYFLDFDNTVWRDWLMTLDERKSVSIFDKTE